MFTSNSSASSLPVESARKPEFYIAKSATVYRVCKYFLPGNAHFSSRKPESQTFHSLLQWTCLIAAFTFSTTPSGSGA